MITCLGCGSLTYEVAEIGWYGRLTRLLGMVLFECYRCRTQCYVHTRIPLPVVLWVKARLGLYERPVRRKRQQVVEVQSIRWSPRVGLIFSVRVVESEVRDRRYQGMLSDGTRLQNVR